MESQNHRPMFGKYSGRITADGADDEGRIEVELTAILHGGKPAKMRARPCFTPGIFFLPRKGDEVWIEFEEGDPAKPVWSGVHRRKGGKGLFKAAKGDDGAIVIQCGDSEIVMKKDSIELKCGQSSLVLQKDKATMKAGQSSLAMEQASLAAACVQHKLAMDAGGTTLTSQAGTPSPIFLNPYGVIPLLVAHVHAPPVPPLPSPALTPLTGMIPNLSSK